MFRSQDVELLKLVMSMESAWDVVNYIGSLEMVMIKEKGLGDFMLDKGYTNQLKLLDFWTVRLNQISDKCQRYGVKYSANADRIADIQNSISQKIKTENSERVRVPGHYFQHIEDKVKNLENYFRNFEEVAAKLNAWSTPPQS
jgi:hypothetical protein